MVGRVCVGGLPRHEVNEGLKGHEAAVVGVNHTHDAVELGVTLPGGERGGAQAALERGGERSGPAERGPEEQGLAPGHTPPAIGPPPRGLAPQAKGPHSPRLGVRSLCPPHPRFWEVGAGEWIKQVYCSSALGSRLSSGG